MSFVAGQRDCPSVPSSPRVRRSSERSEEAFVSNSVTERRSDGKGRAGGVDLARVTFVEE